jgi:hypothetical protein
MLNYKLIPYNCQDFVGRELQLTFIGGAETKRTASAESLADAWIPMATYLSLTHRSHSPRTPKQSKPPITEIRFAN